MDRDGHGTHVAGTIGARGDNKLGVAGVCWRVPLMAVKIFDDQGQGTTVELLRGIEYSVRMGARVLCVAGQAPGESRILENLITEKFGDKVLLVTAAGNAELDIDQLSFIPATTRSFKILTVLLVARNEAMSWFSNYGVANVDLGAPGGIDATGRDDVGIFSTLPGDKYGYRVGTSMSAAMSAGAAAPIWGRYPDLTANQVRHYLMTRSWKLDGLNVRAAAAVSLT